MDKIDKKRKQPKQEAIVYAGRTGENGLRDAAEDPPYLIVDTCTCKVGWCQVPYGDPTFEKLVTGAHRNHGYWDAGIQAWRFRDATTVEKMVALAATLGITRCCRSNEDRARMIAEIRHALPPIRYMFSPTGVLVLRQSPGTKSLLQALRERGIRMSAWSHAQFDAYGRTTSDADLIVAVPKERADEALRTVSNAHYELVAETAGEPLPLHVGRDGWLVWIDLPVLANPWLATACSDRFVWVGEYPYGRRVYDRTPVHDGIARVECSVAEFPDLAEQILARHGSAPSLGAEEEHKPFVAIPVGWNTPAPNGKTLYDYQRRGVEFVVQRGGRCLIGDEMGVGKTAQAIAAAQAIGADRKVLVIAPANARYVWDREIRGWLGDVPVQHISGRSDRVQDGAAWVIASYDQIVVARENWRPRDATERDCVLKWLVRNKLIEGEKEGEKASENEDERTVVREATRPKPIPLPEAASEVGTHPSLDAKRLRQWQSVMQRMRGELLASLDAWAPDLAVVDEAHRAKNRGAKRTHAVERFSQAARGTLLLTGTPVRNNGGDAVNLMRLIDPRAYARLAGAVHDKKRVKAMLKCLMIRRLKKDVAPELPPWVRQEWPLRVDVPKEYFDALDYALESRIEAVAKGASERQAREAMQGGLATARRLLGEAKVPCVAETVQQIVDGNERHCCVVFAWHRDVIQGIADALDDAGLKVGVIRGDVPAARRAEVVDCFQAGDLDVIVANHQSGGEAITLTRADTVVFAEHDWVPGVIRQAEARIHRTGQTAAVCHTYHLLVSEDCLASSNNLDIMLWDVLGSKLAAINDLLDEHAEIGRGASVQNAVIDRIIRGRLGSGTATPTVHAVPPLLPVPAPTPERAVANDPDFVSNGSALGKANRVTNKRVTNSKKGKGKPVRAAARKGKASRVTNKKGKAPPKKDASTSGAGRSILWVRRKTRDRVRAYRQRNPDKYREYMRDYMRKKRARAKH